jgi:hypothetical protein
MFTHMDAGGYYAEFVEALTEARDNVVAELVLRHRILIYTIVFIKVSVPNQQNAYIKVEKVQTQIYEELEDTKGVIRRMLIKHFMVNMIFW